jgi:curved DNA-binding protein CbpA
MNIEEACAVLDMSVKEMTGETLRRKYLRLALLHHPDKGGDAERFRRIKEAYEYLTDIFLEEEKGEGKEGGEKKKEKGEGEKKKEKGKKDTYTEYVRKWIFDYLADERMANWVQKLVLDSVLPEMDMDHETLLFLVDFLTRYADLLSIPEPLLEKMRKKTMEKAVMVVRPTLDDLFDNNVFKWEYKDQVFWVPMWHHEVVFEDKEGKELCVRIVPEVPSNVRIDENNDVVVKLELSLREIWEKERIEWRLGSRCFSVERESLFVKEEQWVVLKNQGISRINEKNWYNVDERMDLRLFIKMSL